VVDFDRLLRRPVMRVFGKPVTYVSPDGLVVLGHLVGTVNRQAVVLEGDAENTGGIAQMRTILRLRAADFPADVEPEQGALVTVDGERKVITDILADPAGWYDFPLADAPE
jgi:hypothetical protein